MHPTRHPPASSPPPRPGHAGRAGVGIRPVAGSPALRRALPLALGCTLSACNPIAVLGIAGVAGLAAAGAGAGERSVLLAEDFSRFVGDACLPDGAEFGSWRVAFAGYGCVRATSLPSGPVLSMRPAAASRPEQTHAALVLGPPTPGPFALRADVRTPEQLRTGSPANPWEVAWVVWSFADNEHFYYFVPKPNGWELGKRDPAYPGGQRFLATGSRPAFAPGAWARVRVEHAPDGEMRVAVGGREVVRFRDSERPYGAGRIGFYTEDAEIQVRDVLLRRAGS